MLSRFLKFIHDNHLLKSEDKVLLAVSGGIDSMTLVHLFQQTTYNFSVAHCNFKLRGKESDTDEAFVREYCEANDILLHLTSFETKQIASEKKKSIQEIARDLRYAYFYELAEKYQYTKIAIAHNLNDSVETFFINLTRGAGIDGLLGISIQHEKLIRPLQFAKRTEIETYASTHRVGFRTDQSNLDTKYTRNKIRHQVLPVLEGVNPAFLEIVNDTTQRLKEVSEVFHTHIEWLKKHYQTTEKGSHFIDRGFFSQALNTVRFEFLKPFGFSFDTVEKLAQPHETGKQFFSPYYSLTIDRKQLIIEKKQEHDFNVAIDISEDGMLNVPLRLTWRSYSHTPEFKLSKKNNVAMLDKDLLPTKLLIRPWQEGDFFNPLGLKAKKKLSDFFIDQKIALTEKKRIPLLCTQQDIIWVMNKRIDDRFKITDRTKNIICFEIEG